MSQLIADIGDPKAPLAFLETKDHRVYIRGYPDSTVRPDLDITRAEVAAVFHRLLQEAHRGGSDIPAFGDVPYGAWYGPAIGRLADLGIILGYSDGTFRPDNTITRAEFAAIATRFNALAPAGGIVFSDVPMTFWAVGFIHSAYAKGWVNGYDDGAFRPAQHITRAEAVKIVNTMLHRLPARLPDILINPFIDINDSHWAYVHILEASTEHTYARNGSGKEFWTTHICPVTKELLIHVDEPELLPPSLQ